MQVSTANDVKVYNLSAGKSLPEWMSNEAKRKLGKKNFDVRRRIQLLQDFAMPDISNTVDISPDGRYVFATGAYKPVLKCYDLNDLSLKFERGLDADVKKMLILSDDYSKFVMMEEDRYIEMHAAFGRYFRMRIPRFGRDMAFSKECSDLYMVGAGDEIFRLNLELGEWLSPLPVCADSVNCCQFNEDHQLFVCGTSAGTVEAWDHRDKNRVGILDCKMALTDYYLKDHDITALKFKDALHLSVGTSQGQILSYDMRSSKPLFIKDHNNGLAIKKIDFVDHDDGDLTLSLDSRVLKIWNSQDGKPFLAIETDTQLTDFNRYPDSGLLFFANESPRMLQYFVPALGPAPKWCSFLENITEELEESAVPTVYDDYKFVTKQQLEDVGLTHLIGTTVLRAYMHGYFINAQLFNKAQTLTQPFALKKYKERKVKDLLEAEREKNVVKKKDSNAPKVNKLLAEKLKKEAPKKGKKSNGEEILADDRFKQLFQSEDFEIDENSEEFVKKYAHLATKEDPVDEKDSSGDDEEEDEDDEDEEMEQPDFDDKMVDPMEGVSDSDIHSSGSEAEELSGKKLSAKEAKKKAKERMERREQAYLERKTKEAEEKRLRQLNKPTKFVLHELEPGESSSKFMDSNLKGVREDGKESLSMLRRRQKVKKSEMMEKVQEEAFGGKSITFSLEKKGDAGKAARDKARREEHQKERQKIIRAPTEKISKNLKKLPANVRISQKKK